jgi:peptide methionine sulfoxide reductase MsrB
VTTTIAVWAAAFDQADFPWLREMDVEHVFGDPLKDYRVSGQYKCRLCEQLVFSAGREKHAAQHLVEFNQWQRDQKAAEKAQQELVA